MQGSAARPLKSRRSGPLRGTVAIPGDKSVSHRALILGALAVGRTKIAGLLEAEDVLNTAEAMRRFGAQLERHDVGQWSVWGTGVGGWAEPETVLDFGNSGTGSRLVIGATDRVRAPGRWRAYSIRCANSAPSTRHEPAG